MSLLLPPDAAGEVLLDTLVIIVVEPMLLYNGSIVNKTSERVVRFR